ncbi:creatininase family protein [Affinibrenneria salicis]|uniref:Creatininase family protein n=1 Tax=Affinibrenneria salicis TaxID=2590031 RepID=A0A5J5FWS6_9GAMM|nr:creatininase family protein [Affinibrenneria salicis]KAA8998440.1 creatininase family protein [Affinibrenneria salicis]
MRLDALTEREARQALAAAHIALLPLGATEPHGDHLPLGTDNLLAERFCALLDEALGADAITLPTLPYSQVWSLQGHAGAIDIGNDLLTALLVALARNMRGYGINTTAVINAHYGNFDAMRAAARRLKDEDLTLLGYSWAGMAPCAARLQSSREAWPGYMHADEIETSLMLALAPETVQMAQARPHYPAFPQDFPWRPIRWTEFCDYAVLGDPSQASREKGDALLEATFAATLSSLRRHLPREENA